MRWGLPPEAYWQPPTDVYETDYSAVVIIEIVGVDILEKTWGPEVARHALREAAQVLEEGVATKEQIDALMTDCFNWPVGPYGMVQGASSGWGQ